MRIILDECVPSMVKRGLPARSITTVQEKGWAGIKNGELLKLVSVDYNIRQEPAASTEPRSL